MRVAALDVGTNTTRALIADVADGRVDEVVRRTTITRLGEGLGRSRNLLPTAVARVRKALDEYMREVDRHGVERALLVATSAVRDSDNGEELLRDLERAYGVATRLVDGREEAELAFRGVESAGLVRGRTLVLDVGGGSTELIVGGRQGVDEVVSAHLGSVRSTERFLHSDPPAPDELAALRQHARSELGSLHAEHAVGVAGSVTTIAALDLDLETYDRDRVHGHVLARAAVEAQLARLAAMPLGQRLRIPALEPGRAPVIVAGAAIVAEAMQVSELDELVASEHDLLDGIALLAAQSRICSTADPRRANP
jgi:exopolyphosphatase/guanosine-5'-triphosphate,3'-diphosphate pyrophosphatase